MELEGNGPRETSLRFPPRMEIERDECQLHAAEATV
jgi:hypothetical protein